MMSFLLLIPWALAVIVGITAGWFIRRKPISKQVIWSGLNGVVLGLFSLVFYTQIPTSTFGCAGWGCVVMGPVIMGFIAVSVILAVLSVLGVGLVIRLKRNRS